MVEREGGGRLAVVLLSGGLDSCVATAILRDRGYETALLHATYRQRTAERERRAFEEVADFYGVEQRLVVDIAHLAAIGGSSLTDETIAIADGDLESEEIPATYVPFRNANLLAIAASWAEVLGADAIAIGAVAEDSSGYPDCRPAFFTAFEAAIDAGTRPETRLQIETPIIGMSKGEIIRTGRALGAPIYRTWSCYRSNGPEPCGSCDSCLLRQRGEAEASL